MSYEAIVDNAQHTNDIQWSHYSKTGLKRPLKNKQNKVLNGSLMTVESIVECIPQYFWSALSDTRSWKTIFDLLFEWPLKTGFTVAHLEHILKE